MELGVESSIETKYVVNAYNKIARNFDITRMYIWPCVISFLDTIDKKSFVLDVGCGNGKTIKYLKKKGFVFVKGCDISSEFVKICQEKHLDVESANILNVPYETSYFDCVICTAVIHHLSIQSDRINAIDELIRITKSGGTVLISVASFENQFYKEHNDKQDAIIPWKNSSGEHIVDRYYYLFKINELETLCSYNKDIEKIDRLDSLYNWSVIITKK
jgi:ubiquinone/menaquinone biosynthesis C-methylase UbiE